MQQVWCCSVTQHHKANTDSHHSSSQTQSALWCCPQCCCCCCCCCHQGWSWSAQTVVTLRPLQWCLSMAFHTGEHWMISKVTSHCLKDSILLAFLLWCWSMFTVGPCQWHIAQLNAEAAYSLFLMSVKFFCALNYNSFVLMLLKINTLHQIQS